MKVLQVTETMSYKDEVVICVTTERRLSKRIDKVDIIIFPLNLLIWRGKEFAERKVNSRPNKATDR